MSGERKEYVFGAIMFDYRADFGARNRATERSRAQEFVPIVQRKDIKPVTTCRQWRTVDTGKISTLKLRAAEVHQSIHGSNILIVERFEKQWKCSR